MKQIFEHTQYSNDKTIISINKMRNGIFVNKYIYVNIFINKSIKTILFIQFSIILLFPYSLNLNVHSFNVLHQRVIKQFIGNF